MIAGFKVSAGVVLLAGLGAAALVDLIVNRKLDLFYLLITLGVSNFAVIKFMTKEELLQHYNGDNVFNRRLNHMVSGQFVNLVNELKTVKK